MSAKEVDEAAMMADPLTGPGHSLKGQVAKPDYERFERDLSLGHGTGTGKSSHCRWRFESMEDLQDPNMELLDCTI